MKHFVRLAGLLALCALLASCTVTVRPGDVSVSGRVRFGIEVNDVIRVFEPTRGSGSVYLVGDLISFRVLTNRDGYITMTVLSPSGNVETFARNIYVRGGQVNVISGPDDASVFQLVPPRGLHRVRASFTPARTSGSVIYRNSNGEGQWTESIVTEVRDYDVRDIAETRFFIQ
mgnify:CR=1 FL=1